MIPYKRTHMQFRRLLKTCLFCWEPLINVLSYLFTYLLTRRNLEERTSKPWSRPTFIMSLAAFGTTRITSTAFLRSVASSPARSVYLSISYKRSVHRQEFYPELFWGRNPPKNYRLSLWKTSRPAIAGNPRCKNICENRASILRHWRGQNDHLSVLRHYVCT